MPSGFCIKQPSEAVDVPGTVVMLLPGTRTSKNSPEQSPPPNGEDAGQLKLNKHGIVLNPQPHDNPNDPLNWPIWRRDIALGVIGFYSFIIGGMTPLLAPVMTEFKTTFHESLNTLTYLVGAFMMAMGVSSLFFAPSAVLYGKRLIYLVSQVIFFGSCLWGAKAKSFGSLLGARILMGIGSGPAESLPSASIAEIFFAHERAYRTGIYTLLLLGGKNLIPLVSGFVANSLGWHWIFWILAIIAGTFMLLTFLFVHETWWERIAVPNQRSIKESEMAERARQQMHRPAWQPHPDSSEHTRDCETINNDMPAAAGKDVESETDSRTVFERKPFFANLAVYTGRKCDSSWPKVFLRPFALYIYPPILFSTLLYGTSVVWLSVIAETISTIFSQEPYNFPVTSIGLLYLGTFIGGCLGSAVAGLVSDRIVRYMSSHNGGIYEPEFRLIMVGPVLISVTIGLMGFGWSTFDKDLWIVPTIFLGILGFGTSLGSTVAITYAVDSYRIYAAEALVSLNFAKNAMGFGFAIFVPIFFHKSGGRTSYIVYGSVEIGVCLLAIPLYRYGKLWRKYMHEHDIVKKLY